MDPVVEGPSDTQFLISTLSLTNRIPPDILLEIFGQCLPSAHNPIIHPNEAPTILTRVCYNWRHLALSAPFLWQSIHVPVSTTYPFSNSTGGPNTPIFGITKAIAAWFERSNGRPMNISIDEEFTTSQRRLSATIIKVVLSVSDRWQHFQLRAGPFTIDDLFHHLKGRTLPLLQTLSLSKGLGGPKTWKNFSFTCNFEAFHAPSLTGLFVSGFEGNFLKFSCWSQLMHLTMDNVQMVADGVPLLLRLCSNLQSCRMDISVDGGLRNDPGSPIELRYLEKLSIREWGDNFSALFPLIHAPLLTQLEYRKRGMGPISCTIIPLLDQAHIHTLITDGQLFETIQFLELLRHTPQLRSVIFKPSCFDDSPCTISMEELLHTLTTADDDLAMAYIPELEEFECHVLNDISTSTLVKFIMNRQTKFTSQKLRSVVVTFPGPQKDISELEDLLPFIVMGELTVKIRYASGSQLLDFGGPLGSIQNTLSSHPF